MTAKVFEHPFDLGSVSDTLSLDQADQNIVKVRLQSQPTDRPLAFTGPLDCFRQTYLKEGWRGLYRVSRPPSLEQCFLTRCIPGPISALRRSGMRECHPLPRVQQVPGPHPVTRSSIHRAWFIREGEGEEEGVEYARAISGRSWSRSSHELRLVSSPSHVSPRLGLAWS